MTRPGQRRVRSMPTKWNFEAEYIQSCNCAWGCPCNFDALPTTGNCEALVSWHIRKGTFGSTKLDGVTFAWGLWWPKAIHMGGGTGRVYVDPKAKPDQAGGDRTHHVWSRRFITSWAPSTIFSAVRPYFRRSSSASPLSPNTS